MTPPLLQLANLELYRSYFKATYCLRPLVTHDGITVRFRQNQFGHIAQESSQRDGVKDTLSTVRLERLSWIKHGLKDSSLILLAGWDNKKKVYDHKRRVTLMVGDFVIVLALKNKEEADFVTCYLADSPRTKGKLQTAPLWKNPFV